MSKKDFVYLPNGEIRYKGTTYPGITLQYKKITFNPKEWFEHWNQNILDIKKSKLDYFQIQHIHENYIRDILAYSGSKQMIKKHQQVNELSNRLVIAFYQSYSNYRDSKKGIFGFISGLLLNKLIENLKFPRFPLNKK